MKINILLLLFFCLISTAYTFAGQNGKASFYSHRLKGRHTSDGGKYQPDSMTCAHRSFPFGTLLRVRNPKNNKEVIVKVTDRGPHRKRYLIDLSYSAASLLDIVRDGSASVEIVKLDSVPSWQIAIKQDSTIALNSNGMFLSHK